MNEKLNNLLNNFEEFSNQLIGVAHGLTNENEVEIIEEVLDGFYVEGWEYNYGQSSFYEKGDRMLEIEKLLDNTGSTIARDKYENLKIKVWKNLPLFYEKHQGTYEDQRFPVPEGYAREEAYGSK